MLLALYLPAVAAAEQRLVDFANATANQSLNGQSSTNHDQSNDRTSSAGVSSPALGRRALQAVVTGYVMDDATIATAVDECTSEATNFDCPTSQQTYGPIETWDVSAVSSYTQLFHDNDQGNLDWSGLQLSTWSVGATTSMIRTFRFAVNFNGDISAWNVSQVEVFEGTFQFARSFDQDLSNWNVQSATSFKNMFHGANVFNCDLSQWRPLNLQLVDEMFASTLEFDGDLSGWDVSNVQTLNRMFQEATAFTGRGLQDWDVGGLMYMPNAFWGATSFNADISNWNVANVVSFSGGTCKNDFLRASQKLLSPPCRCSQFAC